MTFIPQSVTHTFELLQAVGTVALTLGPILIALVLIGYEGWKRKI